MDNKSSIPSLTIAAVVIGLLVICGIQATKPTVTVTQPIITETPVGALSGPDIASRYLRWGGVAQHNYSTTYFTAATTTPIAIQSPAATSTLLIGSGCRFDHASTTAKAVRFSKGATQYATTTYLFGANVAANAYATIVATTSLDAFVFEPNSWFVGSLVGGTGVDSPSGVCNLRFVTF